MGAPDAASIGPSGTKEVAVMSTEDSWGEDDDSAFAFHAMPETHPVKLAMNVFRVMRGGTFVPERVREAVTPESVEAWGDFGVFARMCAAIDAPAFGSIANPAYGASDVVYVKVLSGVQKGYTIRQDGPVMAATVFTLVWRPELGGWRIHAAGSDYVLPEDVPRSAPNAAPPLS